MTGHSSWGILPRAAFTISLIAVIAGSFSIGITMILMRDRASENAAQELALLLDTVESTVQIACFVADRALASEVAGGLLKNKKVLKVTIRAGLSDLVIVSRTIVRGENSAASEISASEAKAQPMIRRIYSPFDPTILVGEITATPDLDAISDQALDDVVFLGLILAAQWLIIGVGLLALILATVIRPIKLISDKLHRLKLENGEQLTLPRRNVGRELNRLVLDINALSSRLLLEIRQAKDQAEFLNKAKLKDDVLTRQLAEQNVALARAIHVQEEVERIARHDLKTPLSSIATIPSLLRQSKVFSPEEDALLSIVENSAKRVLRMVSLSLDLFRMEQGIYEFNAKPIDLTALVKNLGMELSEDAKRKAITLVYLGTEKPVFACGEEILCYSIIANILKNAIEAAPIGAGIEIKISLGAKVRLQTSNPGVVPLSIRTRFFEKYVSSGKECGTGLGTYSARLMARIQKGDLLMETSDSAGTTLTLELDEWKGDPLSVISESPSSPSRSGLAMRLPALSVLLVDDDPDNTLIMKRLLPSPPLTVASTQNGLEALKFCEDGRPDIIFMDLEMPIMNGFDSLKGIRQLQAEKGVLPSFVVAFSAHDDEISRARSLDAGFDKHLSKPSSQAEIFALICGRDDNGIVENEHSVAKSFDAIIWVDQDILDAIPGFLETRLSLLQEASLVIEKEDREALRKISHKLKGSFLLYGFKWAADACRRIEDGYLTIDFFTVKVQIDAIKQHLLNAEIRSRGPLNSNVSSDTP